MWTSNPGVYISPLPPNPNQEWKSEHFSWTGQASPEVQNGGISGPQKGLISSKIFFEKRALLTQKIIVSSLIVVLKAGQVRCGEHSDYGSITLLFQDGAGGLEVKLSFLSLMKLKIEISKNDILNSICAWQYLSPAGNE